MIDDIDKILRPDADDNIDEDLKREGLFCVWKGADKEPFDPRTEKHACVNDPNTFTTFQEAKTAYNSDGEWDGIGMLNQGGYGFIDVDGCVENGEVNEYARGIITLVHGYTEFSPSGTGVRIVFWIDVKNQTCAGGKPWAEGKEVYDKYHYQKNPSNHTEAYFPMYTNRYATITGHVVPGCEGWKARGVNFENLRTFLNQYMKRPVSEDTEQGHARDIENNPQPVDDIPDTELVDKIRDSSQGEKFSLLYDTPVDPDATGESEGDQALADILCWWTCHDRNRIEKLMFQSQRVRDKWERQDYIDNTISKALQKISDFEGFMYEGEGGIDLEGAIKSFYETTDTNVNTPQNVPIPQSVSIDIIPTEQPPKPVPIDYLKYTASNIDVKLPEFLFYPYIPRGYFTILSASPGVGKTYFSCWLSAMITKGEPLNDRSVVKSRKVLYCSMEDGAQDTLVPRFRACGGVDENFIILDTSAEINPTCFNDPIIKRFIEDLSPDLIIFDAVTSYIGSANMNHANEVRNALKPLIKIIEGTGTAVLLIAHNNKMSSDGSAQNRISGSVDFSAVVRSGINVGRNPDNKDNLAVGHFKSNFTKCGATLEFQFQESEFQDIPAVKLIGELEDVSANDLVNSTQPERTGSGGRPNNLIEEVKAVITETLQRFGGWGLASFIKDQVKEETGASPRTIMRAFQEMKDFGVAFQDMDRDEFGKNKASYWRDWSVDELPENPGKAWSEKFEKQETVENVITFPA